MSAVAKPAKEEKNDKLQERVFHISMLPSHLKTGCHRCEKKGCSRCNYLGYTVPRYQSRASQIL